MKRRKHIYLKDKKYACIEILYKDRNSMPKRESVCVACYVTLPKVYRAIQVEVANPHEFSQRYFSGIVYSFLIVPVCCGIEATLIAKLLGRSKVLEVG